VEKDTIEEICNSPSKDLGKEFRKSHRYFHRPEVSDYSRTISDIFWMTYHQQDINMDTNAIEVMFDLDNNLDEVRGHSLNMSIHRPRSPSLSSSKCKKEYHIRVKQESNRIDKDISVNSSSNFSLEYVT